jgi:hypothetical protein
MDMVGSLGKNPENIFTKLCVTLVHPIIRNRNDVRKYIIIVKTESTVYLSQLPGRLFSPSDVSKKLFHTIYCIFE